MSLTCLCIQYTPCHRCLQLYAPLSDTRNTQGGGVLLEQRTWNLVTLRSLSSLLTCSGRRNGGGTQSIPHLPFGWTLLEGIARRVPCDDLNLSGSTSVCNLSKSMSCEHLWTVLYLSHHLNPKGTHMIDLKAYHLAVTYPAHYPTTGPVLEPLVDEPDYWYYGLEECERCLWLFESAVMTKGVCKSCHDARRWILPR